MVTEIRNRTLQGSPPALALVIGSVEVSALRVQNALSDSVDVAMRTQAPVVSPGLLFLPVELVGDRVSEAAPLVQDQ